MKGNGFSVCSAKCLYGQWRVYSGSYQVIFHEVQIVFMIVD
ncbi:hypothetical protein CSC41_4348 [Pseudomonas aeruginosa]|nr:hypothetical protein CSC41_4348 [Pseudomonas aeruginosa]